MRVRYLRGKLRIAALARRVVTALALCAVSMPSMAADLVHASPHVWVSAAALSLTLVTAATRPKQ